MSVWIHVDAFVRTPIKLSKEDLERIFGKELDSHWIYPSPYFEEKYGNEAYVKRYEEVSEHNRKAWEEYEADKTAFLPTGTEGSLEFGKPKKIGEIWQYTIRGILRDYGDDLGICKWFKDKFFEWDVSAHDQYELKPWANHARIEVSSDAEQWIWEINNPDLFE